MPFKFYKNKITHHASISIKQRDKKHWHNLPASHGKSNDSYILIQDPHPKAKRGKKSYVRKYIRVDKKGVKGHPYREYRLSNNEEAEIKKYLKSKHKKR